MENMVSKTIKEPKSKDKVNIPVIGKFPNQIQFIEVVIEAIELIYLMFFHPISPRTNLGT